MIGDLRVSFRSLLRQPSFALIAVLTLSLGIGTISSVFSLIYGVMLTPPPYLNPSQLVLIDPARSDGKPIGHAQGWAALQWMDWRSGVKSLEGLAAYDWSFTYLIRDDGSESLEGMSVTRDYFKVLGLQPLLGRSFNEAEATFPAKPVIILGYELWRRKFNGDPAIVGKRIRISRRETPPEVIGIMPPHVRFLPAPAVAQEPNYDLNAAVQFWLPGATDPEHRKDPRWNLVARLREGKSLKEAQAELISLAAVQAQNEKDFSGIAPRLHSLSAELNREGDRILYPLSGAAALVLLIACGNAASLMLIRGLQRQREYAVRSALGVSRRALIWQASSENLVVAVCGGMGGAALASAITGVFKTMGVGAIPRLDAVNSVWPILAASFVVALLSAVAAGLLPALRASRLAPADVLKSAGPKSSAGRQERRLLRVVAVAQTALSLALLMGAGLLIRTMNNLDRVPLGYDTSHVLTMSVTAVQGNLLDFHRRALERLSHLYGVEHAAFAWGVPLTGNNWPGTPEVEGQPPVDKQSERISLPSRSVTEEYFPLMHMPILRGRNFRASDTRDGSPVLIVNQAFVERYFPRGGALGKKVWFSGQRNAPGVIVGTVVNGRSDDLAQKPQPEIYLSFWQATPFSKHLVVRTSLDAGTFGRAVLKELRAVDPTVSVENVKTMDEIRSDSLAPRTFAMRLLTGFSVVGTLLTLIGVYGLLALSVASRRRELAIRTAVGAQSADIRALIFREGFGLAAGGLVSGVVAAFSLTTLLRSFFFGVGPTDPATLTAACALLLAVILLACWVPSRRAARIDPIEALRYE